MLRRLAAAVGAAGMTLVPSAAVSAAPSTLCTLHGSALAELSGLATDGQHLYAMNDGGSQVAVSVLDRHCDVQKTITSPVDPYDPEDLARASDGTLWLADTGDNRKQRDTVALHALSPDGQDTLYRLTYPDGQHDAEALLLAPNGVPYIVTKNMTGDAGVYRPAGKLSSPGPTRLEHVATVTVAPTSTSGGPVGEEGSVLVTGGAVSDDGHVIALRTYTDAYLYPMTGSDVAGALKRTAKRVPLPGERQGEAVTFDPDGTLLTGGEGGAGQPIHAIRHATSMVEDAPQATRTHSDTDLQSLPAGPTIAVAAGAIVLAALGVKSLRRRS